MVRVVVVACIVLVACDRGVSMPPTAPPPPARDASSPRSDAVLADAGVVADAQVIAAEVVDAAVLAPPKAPAAQKRDCAKAAKKIGTMFGGDKREKTETDAATRKACIEGPWSATVVDCAINAKGEDNPYDCTLLLPKDQEAAWHKATKEVFCKYNDCIPDNMIPRPAGQGSDDEGIPLD